MTPQELAEKIFSLNPLGELDFTPEQQTFQKTMIEVLISSYRSETIEECEKVTEPFKCLAITEAIRQLKTEGPK